MSANSATVDTANAVDADAADAVLHAVRQRMENRQFDVALADLNRLLEARPDQPEALYMSAVCLRYSGRAAQALGTLVRLKALAPELGRAHQEEGHTYRSLGQWPAAEAAYQRATRHNPALLASWRGLVEARSLLAQHSAAQQAASQLRFLETLPRALLAAMDLVAEGKLARAEDLCRQLLRKTPTHVEAMRLLADIGSRLGALDDAEFLLESALCFAPENDRVRVDYVQVLRRQHKFMAALEQAQELLRRSPGNLQYLSVTAVETMQTGDYSGALALFEQVLARLPDDPNTLTSKGHALKTCGRFDEAVASYRAAITSQPGHGEAYYALANLKTYHFSDREIAAMRVQQADSNPDHMDQVYLAFALGKACEDRQQHAEAFQQYLKGNQLKRVQSRYQADQMSRELRAQAECCPATLFATHADAGCPSRDPIFIVGLPRAGSTLLEQILASHSQVDGTLELPNILSLTQRLRRRGDECGIPYPEILHSLTEEELTELGETYLRDTRIHRLGAPRFIDKMPNNFRHLGLIRLMLPRARVIDARRHPMACGFSLFKQLFAEGQEFSYSLSDIGRYYQDYVALMDHWDAVLPGYVLRIQHEDLIVDLEGQVRRILDYCELPFESACLEFHRTSRNIRTPSSEQVRRPVDRSAQHQWRHYHNQLQPLIDALGDDILRRYPLH